MAKIAVMEDSQLMQGVLLRLFQTAGYEVVLWEPGTEAEVSEVAEITAPDLLITDYQMPGIDGLTAIRLARKVNPGLPVIVLTAIRDEDIHEAFKKAEVNAVILKPAAASIILQAVLTLLPKP